MGLNNLRGSKFFKHLKYGRNYMPVLNNCIMISANKIFSRAYFGPGMCLGFQAWYLTGLEVIG